MIFKVFFCIKKRFRVKYILVLMEFIFFFDYLIYEFNFFYLIVFIFFNIFIYINYDF